MESRKVAVVGLGYVGLPLACLCARKGYEVIGVDINKEIIEKTNKGISHIRDEYLEKSLRETVNRIKAVDSFNKITEADTVVVCVPTPVDENHKPDLKPLKSACEEINKHLRRNHLIIIESTIYPGTTEEIVKPILEKKGLKTEEDFYLAHCPERIDPGNKKWRIENIPRVVGSVGPIGLKKAAEFYRTILEAPIHELSTVKAAEAVKIVENSFRDVNIAFVNELAKSFDRFGIDISEVIKGASTKPFGYMPFYPGCGVGGHCIPVDPYYLIEKAAEEGFEHRFLKLAREINHSMPEYTVNLLEEKIGDLRERKIGVLGVAYKADVDDTRESPALEIIKILQRRGAQVLIYDPHVPSKNNVKNLDQLLDEAKHLIIATDHREFREIDLQKLKQKNIKTIIDGRNCLNKEEVKKLGIIYKGIGR